MRHIWMRLKRLWRLSAEYDKDVIAADRRMAAIHGEVSQKIGERTTVHADIHYMPYPHAQVIVIGKYMNRDYVRAYSIKQDHLGDLVDMLKVMEKDANVGYMDMPFSAKFSAVYPSNRF